jgi:hypothetical protein
MQTLITTSGYTLIPPTSLAIVTNSIQLAVTASGSVAISGSLGTLNNIFYTDGELIPLEVHFLQTENVTVTPSAGSAILNYVYGGEPEAYKYAKAVQDYSAASGIAPLWNTVVLSGSFKTGFGG